VEKIKRLKNVREKSDAGIYSVRKRLKNFHKKTKTKEEGTAYRHLVVAVE
jgi:hypothetical protein